MDKTGRWRSGNIVAIPLSEGFGFGRLLRRPIVAFYDLSASIIPSIEDIVNAGIAFKIFVRTAPIVKGTWKKIGYIPLSKDLEEEPFFFKKDPMTGKLSLYNDNTGEEFPATLEQCEKLERAAVWDPNHVVDRLEDHFAKRPNKWVESLRP